MKRIVKLIIILSLLAPVCQAQKIETEEEYKVVYDSIVSRLRLAQKEVNDCVGKPFPELVKHLDKYGLKIIRASASERKYERGTVEPKYFFGLDACFISKEISNFAWQKDLREPLMYVSFKESKLFETYLKLLRKYEGRFVEEVEAFYSDAVVKSVDFYIGDMYTLRYYQRQKGKL